MNYIFIVKLNNGYRVNYNEDPGLFLNAIDNDKNKNKYPIGWIFE